jgi:LysM repeat protein
MKSLCTKGILYFSLALLVVAAAACTQSRPAVPTPTLVPLSNETIVAPSEGQPTPIIIQQATPGPGEPTLVPPPLSGETPVPAAGETPASGDSGQIPTPILVEPTLLPTPTTVGDTGQPVPTPAPGTDTTGQPATGACSSPYTVKPGEWFLLIARNCGVTPQALQAANPGVNPNLLRPGQVLNIPGGGTSGGSAAQPTPASGQEQPSQPGTCSNPYVVQRGDTLYSIAQRCGTTVQAIQQANGIPSPEYIFPGQQLRIP